MTRSGKVQYRPDHTDLSARHYFAEHREEILAEQRGRLTITCPADRCTAPVVRIERHHVTVEWSLDEQPDGPGGVPVLDWTLGTHDNGTHFHLFCADGHEVKRWGHNLPERLKRVVFPGDE